MIDYIKNSIKESISTKENLLKNEDILSTLETVSELIYKSISSGGRVLICGNGGSAADAQHIAAELVVRFVHERKGLAAIALTTDSSILTAIGNDYGFNYLFERQVEALAQKGDVLIGISTSGNSGNVLAALRKARELGVTTVGLLGRDGGQCVELCDYNIIINTPITARAQESHILCGHIICGIVDELVRRENQHKAIFLDRDGTINVDSGYTHKVEELKFIDGAVEALKLFKEAGYKLFIITNQSGIARGYFTQEQYNSFNDALTQTLAQEGVIIEQTLMCPHSPEEECACRKPSPYLIETASQKHNIDRSKSFMLGDKESDIKCGINAGVTSYRVTESENILYWAKKILKENR